MMTKKKQGKPKESIYIDQSKRFKADTVSNSPIIFGNSSGTIEINSANTSVAGNLDIKRLADELAQLRVAMRHEASDEDHDVSVAEIAKAEKAARTNDEAGLISHLRSAGGWALEIASKIGTSLATDALKQALGVK